MLTFESAINRVLGHEGGYVNNPADPGGETNWGIAKRSYPHVDIRGLTREGAIAIYKRDFWDRVHADELPAGLRFQALDAAVNSGIESSVRWLQRAAGVADDGHWGPITRAAVKARGENDMIMRFNAIRLDFMTRLGVWPNFGRGWARRIAQNLMYGAEDNLD